MTDDKLRAARPDHNHPRDSLCLVSACPRGAWNAALAASADEGPRCPTCNSGQYRQPLCSDPWHAARPAVPETLDVDAVLDIIATTPTLGLRDAMTFQTEVHHRVAALRSKESA